MKLIYSLILGLSLTWISFSNEESKPVEMPQATSYSFNHGPYIQELTPSAVTVMFTTDKKGFSWVEVKRKGSPDDGKKAYYAVKDGLRNADVTFNAISINGLEPGKEYEYRLCSKEVTSFQPYSVKFGAEISSPWYTVKTIAPNQKTCSILATSDIHDNAKKLKQLLEYGDYKSIDAFFLVGDIMSYCHKEGQPFYSFIDQCVDMFAKEKPFLVVRGNHETRGHLARYFSSYIPRQDGKIYGTQSLGDTFVIFLDCGEDKPNEHPVYAGLVDFDGYRSEQAEWLKKVIASPEFKKAKHRIVMSHFPILEPDNKEWEKEYGMNDLSKKTFDILNKAKIDLLIAGHTHQFKFYEPIQGKRSFPILVGSDKSAARLDVSPGGIKIRAYDQENKTLLEKELK